MKIFSVGTKNRETLLRRALNKVLQPFTSNTPETFYHVTRDGNLKLDTYGLLKSGRMDRQLQAARDLKAARDLAQPTNTPLLSPRKLK